MGKTIKIKRIGEERLHPRDSCAYFMKNKKDWYDMKWGKVIDIPEEIFKELKGVEIVKESKERKGGLDG